MDNKKDIKRARLNSEFQQENLLGVELSEEAAHEVKYGSQSQGLSTSYGAPKAEKKQPLKLDRDY